ncbi:Hsp20/alpha crystallin family protein [Verrucomicrobiota bacterium sgz303538]
MTLKNLVPWKRGHEGMAVRRSESPLDVWRSEMDRLFSRAMFSPMGGDLSEGMMEHQFPEVDVTETEKEVQVTAELPGIDEKDLEVTVDQTGLTLRGEKREEREEEKKGYYLSECSYGSFHRHIPLPEALITDKAEAKFKNGVLKITVPKSPEAESKRKTLQIKVE